MDANTAYQSWLTSMDAQRLTRLFEASPFLSLGAPIADLADLHARVIAMAGAAMSGASRPHLQVLFVTMALGRGATVEHIADVLRPAAGMDADQHREAVVAVLADLQEHTLAIEVDGRWVPNPGLDAVVQSPLGIGPPSRVNTGQLTVEQIRTALRALGVTTTATRKADLMEAYETALGDAALVRRVLGGAPQAVRTALRELVVKVREESTRVNADPVELVILRQYGLINRPRAHTVALEWARKAGLVLGGDYYRPMQLPAEVALQMLGATGVAAFDPVEPEIPTVPVAGVQVAQEGASAVTSLLAATVTMLDHIARAPVPTLAAGGVGKRELQRLAKLVAGDAALVRLILEVGAACGLLEPNDAERKLGTGQTFEMWRASSPATRATLLILGWMSLHVMPMEEAQPDEPFYPALSYEESGSVDSRAAMLQTLATLEPGRGAVGPEPLAERLTWQHATAAVPVRQLRTAWAEAHRVGVAALGRLTPMGEFLLSGQIDQLTEHLATVLPPEQETVLLGADLTAVATGSPSRQVVTLLDDLAVRESRGVASTWRFTPASVRSAMDAGYDADAILARLAAVAAGVIPQPLEYLIRDVGRNYGRIGVRPGGAVLTIDDAPLAAELLVHRSLRRLGLVQVGPGVLVAQAPPDDVLAALRSAGYAPAELTADGSAAAVARMLSELAAPAGAPGVPRASGGVRRPGDPPHTITINTVQIPPIDIPDPAEQAARLIAGAPPASSKAVEDEVAHIRVFNRELPLLEVRHLAHAVVNGGSVVITYQSRTGARSTRKVSELSIEEGFLHAWCHLRSDTRVFTLYRILSVAPA